MLVAPFACRLSHWLLILSLVYLTAATTWHRGEVSTRSFPGSTPPTSTPRYRPSCCERHPFSRHAWSCRLPSNVLPSSTLPPQPPILDPSPREHVGTHGGSLIPGLPAFPATLASLQGRSPLPCFLKPQGQYTGSMHRAGLDLWSLLSHSPCSGSRDQAASAASRA